MSVHGSFFVHQQRSVGTAPGLCKQRVTGRSGRTVSNQPSNYGHVQTGTHPARCGLGRRSIHTDHRPLGLLRDEEVSAGPSAPQPDRGDQQAQRESRDQQKAGTTPSLSAPSSLSVHCSGWLDHLPLEPASAPSGTVRGIWFGNALGTDSRAEPDTTSHTRTPTYRRLVVFGLVSRR